MVCSFFALMESVNYRDEDAKDAVKPMNAVATCTL